MPNSNPFSSLSVDRLPIKIDPCPIVEAVFELRFASAQPWATMPGLLYAQIRERYADQKQLPLAQVPDEIRRKEPALTNLPLMQFLSSKFLVQLGPRVVSLVTKPNEYPGWTAIETELRWVLDRVAKAGIVSEGERLGVRYIDFFPSNVFPNLHLELRVGGTPLSDEERQITTVFRRETLTIRLLVTNSAIVGNAGGEPRRGSVLDIDAWFGPLDFDAFTDGLQRFDEAHLAIKRLFFGLLRADYLTTLSPAYE